MRGSFGRRPAPESLSTTLSRIAREYAEKENHQMPVLKLLAIGGPKHGEFIGDGNKPGPFFVPIMEPMTTAATYSERYCVHGDEVYSRNDGDRHFVNANRVAYLYGFLPHEWVRGDRDRHFITGLCVTPDASGAYDRSRLPRLAGSTYGWSSTIRRGVYERKAIADRGVYIYRGEE